MKRYRSFIHLTSLAFLLLPALAAAAEPQILDPADDARTELFGAPIAIDGNVLIAGDRGQTDTGVVYVYIRRDDGNANGAAGFLEVAKLVPSPGTDRTPRAFSQAVAIDGDIIVISAPQEDVGNAIRSGAVYVYERLALSNHWVPVAKLVSPFPQTDSNFGLVVDVDGDRIVVGAPLYDGVHRTDAGAAYVFERDNADGTWAFRAELLPPPTATNRQFAAGLSIDGNRLAIGDLGEHAVYVYEQAGSGPWVETGKIVPPVHRPPFTAIGHRLALEGDTLVIADTFATPNLFGSGVVHVYERAQDTWTRTAELSPLNPVSEGQYGNHLDLQDGIIAIGQDNEGIELDVFEKNEAGEWTRFASVPFNDPSQPISGRKDIAVSGKWLVMRATHGISQGPESQVWVYDIDELRAD